MADGDDDFDEELLAAGGRRRKRTATEMDSEDDAPSQKAVADPTIRKKRGRSEADDDFDSSNKNGPASAQDDAAEDDEDDDDDESDDSDNDYDGLAEGPEDRKMLARMPELQREMLLTERAERRQKEKERSALLGQKPDADAAARKQEPSIRPKRRPAPAAPAEVARAPPPPPDELAEDEDSFDELQDLRRSSRKNTTKMSKVETLQKMKESRQRKDEAMEEMTRALEEEVSQADEHESAAESDFSEDEPASAAEEEDEEAPFDAVVTMQVKRQMIEEWIEQPDFDNTLVGCLVRVAVAVGGGQQLYCMCPVVDVTKGKPYTLPATTKQTDKYIIIENTQRMQTIAVSLVSNSDITMNEFREFHTYRSNEGQPQISLREVEVAQKKIQAANNYRLTPEDLSRMLAEKRSKGQVKKSLASQKADLLRRLEVAKQKGLVDEQEQVEQKLAQVLEAIEQKQQALKGLNDLNRSARMTNWAGLNAANNYQSKLAAATKKDSGSKFVDPYSRKATRLMQYWSTKADDGSKKQDEAELARQATTDADDLGKLQRHEQLQRLNFHVDVSLISRMGVQPKLAKALLGPGWKLQSEHTVHHYDTSTKKLLTPAQYQKLSESARV